LKLPIKLSRKPALIGREPRVSYVTCTQTGKGKVKDNKGFTLDLIPIRTQTVNGRQLLNGYLEDLALCVFPQNRSDTAVGTRRTCVSVFRSKSRSLIYSAAAAASSGASFQTRAIVFVSPKRGTNAPGGMEGSRAARLIEFSSSSRYEHAR